MSSPDNDLNILNAGYEWEYFLQGDQWSIIYLSQQNYGRFCPSNGIHFCKDLVNSALVRLYHALCCFIVIKCLVTLSNTIRFQIQFKIHETSPWSSQPQGKHQSGSSLLRDKLAQPGMLTRVRVVGVVTHVNNHANSANSPHHPQYSPHNRTSHDNQPDNQDVEDQKSWTQKGKQSFRIKGY